MATLADINSILNKIKNGEELKENLQTLVNTLSDNQEVFKDLEISGKKSVLRQYLKNDLDIITPDSLKSAVEAGVIADTYKRIIEEQNLYTKQDTIRPTETLLYGKNPTSLTSAVSRLISEINTDIRKLAEGALEPTTYKEIGIHLTKDTPPHRLLKGSLIDCIKYDIWVNKEKYPTEKAFKEKGLYVYETPAREDQKGLYKTIELRKAQTTDEKGYVTNPEDPIYISNDEVAYFTINKEKTVVAIEEYIKSNLYLIGSLPIKKDFTSIEDLMSVQFIEPAFGFLSSFTAAQEILQSAENLRSNIIGTLGTRQPNNMKKHVNQSGYIDAILSITDGRTIPTGINEKNMRIDEQTIIDKYFAGDKRIYKNSIQESIDTGFPAAAISRTVKVFAADGVGKFAILTYKGQETWIPIGCDFISSKEFDHYWNTSHITGETLTTSSASQGNVTSAVTSVDGFYDPSKIDIDSVK